MAGHGVLRQVGNISHDMMSVAIFQCGSINVSRHGNIAVLEYGGAAKFLRENQRRRTVERQRAKRQRRVRAYSICTDAHIFNFNLRACAYSISICWLLPQSLAATLTNNTVPHVVEYSRAEAGRAVAVSRALHISPPAASVFTIGERGARTCPLRQHYPGVPDKQ